MQARRGRHGIQEDNEKRVPSRGKALQCAAVCTHFGIFSFKPRALEKRVGMDHGDDLAMGGDVSQEKFCFPTV